MNHVNHDSFVILIAGLGFTMVVLVVFLLAELLVKEFRGKDVPISWRFVAAFTVGIGIVGTFLAIAIDGFINS